MHRRPYDPTTTNGAEPPAAVAGSTSYAVCVLLATSEQRRGTDAARCRSALLHVETARLVHRSLQRALARHHTGTTADGGDRGWPLPTVALAGTASATPASASGHAGGPCFPVITTRLPADGFALAVGRLFPTHPDPKMVQHKQDASDQREQPGNPHRDGKPKQQV